MYICLSACPLHKTVHTLRKSYHVGHCAFVTLAAVCSTTLRSRALLGVTLLLGMADGTSSAEDSPDDDRDLSRMCAITGH